MRFLKTALLVLMAVLYVGAGINHFRVPAFYVSIMPDYFPAPLFWVQLSGVIEVILGIALLPTRTRAWAAWAIMAMLVVFLTVHVHMLVHADRFAGVPYWGLVVRFPLQGLLIAWAWWYTVPARQEESAV